MGLQIMNLKDNYICFVYRIPTCCWHILDTEKALDNTKITTPASSAISWNFFPFALFLGSTLSAANEDMLSSANKMSFFKHFNGMKLHDIWVFEMTVLCMKLLVS